MTEALASIDASVTELFEQIKAIAKTRGTPEHNTTRFTSTSWAYNDAGRTYRFTTGSLRASGAPIDPMNVQARLADRARYFNRAEIEDAGNVIFQADGEGRQDPRNELTEEQRKQVNDLYVSSRRLATPVDLRLSIEAAEALAAKKPEIPLVPQYGAVQQPKVHQ